MRLEFALRATEVAKTRQTIEKYGTDHLSYAEILIGNVFMSELKVGGASIFLEDIPLLEFFFPLESCLRYGSKEPQFETELMPENQNYLVTLAKRGPNLCITRSISTETYVINVKFEVAKKQVERAIAELAADIFEQYPEFKYSVYMKDSYFLNGVFVSRDNKRRP